MDYLLGIDLGTTNSKAIIFDLEGEIISTASCSTKTHYEENNRAYYHPEEIWEMVCELIRRVLLPVGNPQWIRALAISSMGEAGIPVDEKGKWLYPAIAWFDTRTEPQTRWWQQNYDLRKLNRITGLPLHPMFSINKIMWLKDNEPNIFHGMKKWLCMPDYLIFRLTGEYATDFSIATRTMAFNLERRRWSEEILAVVNINPEVMPPIYPSGTIVGKVNSQVASQTGLVAGTLVVTGGHDHVCGAFAMGIVEEGSVLDSSGTSESLFVCMDRARLNLRHYRSKFSSGCHVAGNKYYLFGGMQISGGVVEWFKEQFGKEEKILAGEKGSNIYDLLMQEAEKSPPGCSGLFFLPHLWGSGPPSRDPYSRGAYIGLTTYHTRADFIRAVIEGLCYELRYTLESIEKVWGRKAAILRGIGGGFRNRFWRQLKADATGRLYEIPEVSEASALGAALLAGIGAGIYSSEKEALSRIKYDRELIYPRPHLQKTYQHYYQNIYLKLYPTLKSIHHQIHNLETNN